METVRVMGVEVGEIEDNGIYFAGKITGSSQTLYGQVKEAERLVDGIREGLEVLGYGA